MSTERQIRIIWTGFNGVARGHGEWHPASNAEEIKSWAEEMKRGHTLGNDITIDVEWSDEQRMTKISQITKDVTRELA